MLKRGKSGAMELKALPPSKTKRFMDNARTTIDKFSVYFRDMCAKEKAKEFKPAPIVAWATKLEGAADTIAAIDGMDPSDISTALDASFQLAKKRCAALVSMSTLMNPQEGAPCTLASHLLETMCTFLQVCKADPPAGGVPPAVFAAYTGLAAEESMRSAECGSDFNFGWVYPIFNIDALTGEDGKDLVSFGNIEGLSRH